MGRQAGVGKSSVPGEESRIGGWVARLRFLLSLPDQQNDRCWDGAIVEHVRQDYFLIDKPFAES
jgi:hypothetical protein